MINLRQSTPRDAITCMPRRVRVCSVYCRGAVFNPPRITKSPSRSARRKHLDETDPETRYFFRYISFRSSTIARVSEEFIDGNPQLKLPRSVPLSRGVRKTRVIDSHCERTVIIRRAYSERTWSPRTV